MTLTGEDILNALNDLKSPASITAIVTHLSSKKNGSGTNLTEATKDLIEAGLKFGCILEEDGKKYRYKYQTKEAEANEENEKVVKRNNEHRSSGSSGSHTEKFKNKRKEIEHQHSSTEEDDEDENQGVFNDLVECYGPSVRRRRSRSRPRSRRRSRSGKRRSSHRRR